MKVDLGHCTSCGEKNSKFVQNCYKCNALLPWAEGYQAPAPKAEPIAPTLQNDTSPNASPPNSAAMTVEVSPATTPVSPATDATKPATNSDNALQPDVWPAPTQSPSVDFNDAPKKKSVPPYAGWAVAGVLGIACLALWARGNNNSLPAAPIPAATVVAENSTAPTVVGAATTSPAASPSPAALAPNTSNAAPTVSAAPVASASPPVAAPIATGVPTTAPPALAPPAVMQSTAPRIGPSFDELDAKVMDRAKQFTDAQKQNYWNNVVNTKVTWSGKIANVSLNGSGEITVIPQNNSKVVATLDGSQMGRLPSISKGQSITVEGILQAHSATGYTLSQGRIVS